MPRGAAERHVGGSLMTPPANDPVMEELVAAFAAKPEMEWRTSIVRLIFQLQRRVDENTEMTADTQETLNRDVIPRLDMVERQGKTVDEVYEIVKPLKALNDVIGKTARGALWLVARAERCLQRLQRIWRPLALLAIAVVVAWTYYRTGHLPSWLDKLIPLVFGA